jgi:GH15 family glucan-1,4-alpha-glucosidase
VARKGIVLYTNIVYWKALQEIANLAEDLDHQNDAKFYLQIAEALENDIRDYLWRPKLGYYATSLSMDNLSSAGNLLAIAWGFTNEREANSILDHIQAFNMANPVPTQAAYPAYQRSDISIENRLGGIPNYHTDGAWLWIGAWHMIALCKAGRIEEAQNVLSKAAEIIVRDQQIHEVYGPDGRPMSSLFYTSEAPLTWNAGMIIYAFHVIEKYV